MAKGHVEVSDCLTRKTRKLLIVSKFNLSFSFSELIRVKKKASWAMRLLGGQIQKKKRDLNLLMRRVKNPENERIFST